MQLEYGYFNWCKNIEKVKNDVYRHTLFYGYIPLFVRLCEAGIFSAHTQDVNIQGLKMTKKLTEAQKKSKQLDKLEKRLNRLSCKICAIGAKLELIERM